MIGSQHPHIVAVCGSNRDESKTRIVLQEALTAARAAGATTELVDLRDYDIPTFDADHPDVGDADGFTDDALRERVRTLGERVVQYARIEPESSRIRQPQKVTV